MAVPEVRKLPGIIFDDLRAKFPRARFLEFSASPDTLLDLTGRFQGLFFDEQYCAAILIEGEQASRLFLVPIRTGGVEKMLSYPFLIIVGGFSVVIPVTWKQGRGYFCLADLSVDFPGYVSLLAPCAPMLGYLVGRSAQIVREVGFVSTTVYEVDFRPDGDYSYLNASIDTPESD